LEDLELDSHSIGQIAFNVVVVLFLVLVNGFFVAAEFALVKVRPSRLTQVINEGSQKARFVQKVTLKLDSYLSACQLGITLASLGLGWVGEPAVAKLIEPLFSYFHVPEAAMHTFAFAIAFTIITMLHIIIGELAPKSIAIQKTEDVALWLAIPLVGFYKITYPAIWVLNQLSNLVLKVIGLEPASENEHAHTEEEIRILVNESHKSGLINKEESALFDNVFDFSDRVAREAMIPRTSTTILYTNILIRIISKKSLKQGIRVIRLQKTTRIILSVFIHVTDFYDEELKNRKERSEKHGQKILTVPESMELSHVFKAYAEKQDTYCNSA
jgi:CBS domain containing-hemolysin-like protein